MTEMIATFTHISRDASVRQILGRRGELWLLESGADQWVVIGELEKQVTSMKIHVQPNSPEPAFVPPYG